MVQKCLNGYQLFSLDKIRSVHMDSTLKIEAICSSETSVYTRYTRRHNPEDGILHSPHGEKFKSHFTALL
jgi:hypothetical protein